MKKLLLLVTTISIISFSPKTMGKQLVTEPAQLEIVLEKIASGLLGTDKEADILQGTFDWSSLGIADTQLPLVKRAVARRLYLLYGKDYSKQLGIDIGGFSIVELLRYKRIPAAVSDDGSLLLHNSRINDLTGLRDIAGLINLKKLFISGNQIAILPEGIFTGLTNLQLLVLAENQLTTLPKGIFIGLTNLQSLWLDGNRLATLPVESFTGLTNLQKLHLEENELITLPVGIFGVLTNLQSLSLDNNKLITLPKGIFAGLINLQDLWLTHNPFIILPKEVFVELINLEFLWINEGIKAKLYQGKEGHDLFVYLCEQESTPIRDGNKKRHYTL